MKIENNLDNKVSFFGLYCTQLVAKETEFAESPTIRPYYVFMIGAVDTYHLELKPLDSITDEDMAKILGNDTNISFDALVGLLMSNNREEYNTLFVSTIIDKIRLNGFAWPWMGLEVKDLVDYGWIKLKEL